MPYVNLAQIYCELASDGSAEENLERAIERGEQALELSGPIPSVDRWIALHVALANAYLDRMALGNRATNLMKAQQYCKAAANADASEANSEARTELEQCLGRVAMASPSSDRAASLRRAIEHFNRALQFNPWPDGRDHDKIQARLQAAEEALAALESENPSQLDE
jgi:tetratricopeptide (TPR) repeat protein